MIKYVSIVICLILTQSIIAQNTYKKGIVELSTAYNNYMFISNPDKNVLKELRKNSDTDSLKQTASFIIECISKKSKVLKTKFLKLPDDQTLKSIYITTIVRLNMRKEGGPTHSVLIDSLSKTTIPREILVDEFYSTAFIANGNKNKPFNLSKYDFDLNSLNLKTDSEKGIFFLRCMSSCGTQIWGFINIPKPPNTKKAMKLIDKFPKINGQSYYKFSNLYFKDFTITYNDSVQSYKGVYIHKYFDLLLNHLICLNKENKGKTKIRDLLLSSALKEEDLYKYTKHKATLESIYEKKK